MGSAMELLDRELLSSCGLSMVSILLSVTVWPQLALQNLDWIVYTIPLVCSSLGATGPLTNVMLLSMVSLSNGILFHPTFLAGRTIVSGKFTERKYINTIIS